MLQMQEDTPLRMLFSICCASVEGFPDAALLMTSTLVAIAGRAYWEMMVGSNNEGLSTPWGQNPAIPPDVGMRPMQKMWPDGMACLLQI